MSPRHHPTQHIDGARPDPHYTNDVTAPEHDHEHRVDDAIGIGRTAVACTPFERRRLRLWRTASHVSLTIAEVEDPTRQAEMCRSTRDFFDRFADEIDPEDEDSR
jgi:hypothetical protein